MAYQEDPDYPRRSFPLTEEPSYTSWIVGGILAFAVMCGLFFTFGSKTDETRSAVNEPNTTGSAMTTDIPKSPTTDPTNNIIPAGQSRP